MPTLVSAALAICGAAAVASDERGWTGTVSRRAEPEVRVGSAAVGLTGLELTDAELSLESLDCGAADCIPVGGAATGT